VVRCAVVTAVLAGACARETAVWDPVADPELPGAAAGALEWPADTPLPPGFETPPWLTMPEPGRIALGWRTVEMSAGTVELTGPDGPATRIDEPEAALIHHLDLGVLPAATSFHYRVVLASGAAREGVFTTPGPELAEWRFIHLAEFHAPSESDHVARFADAIRAFHPQMAIESGDMMNDGDDDAQWIDYLNTSRPWISNLILLPAHSNHVNGVAGNPLLLSLFELPGNERWYISRYGAVDVVTLDSTYEVSPDVATEPDWIEDSMTAARDAPDPALYTIGVWHYPACSSSYESRSDERRWVIDNLVGPLVAAGGLDLVLVGHDKYYERSMLEVGGVRVPHVMANAGMLAPGAAGGNEPECAPIVTDTDTRSLVMVGVSPAGLVARVIDEEGGVVDEFTVPPHAAAGVR
jgi:hypothetical protein